MAEESNGFWASLQGILTGIAAIITAVTGLYIAVNSDGNSNDTKASTVETVSEVSSSTQTNEAEIIEPIPMSSGAKPVDVAVIIENETKKYEQLPDSGLAALVDCQQFPTVNSVGTLMSWSNNYHQKIIDAGDMDKDESLRSCEKAIDYRGMAHCQAPNDIGIRQALFETLNLCCTAGIEWTDVKKK